MPLVTFTDVSLGLCGQLTSRRRDPQRRYPPACLNLGGSKPAESIDTCLIYDCSRQGRISQDDAWCKRAFLPSAGITSSSERPGLPSVSESGGNGALENIFSRIVSHSYGSHRLVLWGWAEGLGCKRDMLTNVHGNGCTTPTSARSECVDSALEISEDIRYTASGQ